jgi:hypothetical protein
VKIVGEPELHFGYLSNSSKEEFEGISLIHLESIGFSVRTSYNLSLGETDGEDEGGVVFDGSVLRGCAFSIKSVGNYSISFLSASAELFGRLVHNASLTFSVDGLWDNFFSDVNIYWMRSPTPMSSSTPTPMAARTHQFSESLYLLASRNIWGSAVFIGQTMLFSEELAVSTILENSATLKQSSLNPSWYFDYTAILASQRLVLSDELTVSNFLLCSAVIGESRSLSATDLRDPSSILLNSNTFNETECLSYSPEYYDSDFDFFK